MKQNKPLLSLCIPTYNRAKFLDILIKKIGRQINELEDSELIEFIVSDNCSSDDTPSVVKRQMDNGIKIKYIRNEKNLGMDGNFVSCFKKASGSYIWLLGDDDFLIEGALQLIISILKKGDYGLIHLNQTFNNSGIVTYSNKSSFLADISYWITFISANIVNSRFVPEIDFGKYMGTYFTLIPLYMTSAINYEENIMINKPIFEGGKDYSRNGGYNFFQVFVVNYLSIWEEMISVLPNKGRLIKKEKNNLFDKFLIWNIWNLLILKNQGNYNCDNGWNILFKYYGKNLHAYVSLIKYSLIKIYRKIFK